MIEQEKYILDEGEYSKFVTNIDNIKEGPEMAKMYHLHRGKK